MEPEVRQQNRAHLLNFILTETLKEQAFSQVMAEALSDAFWTMYVLSLAASSEVPSHDSAVVSPGEAGRFITEDPIKDGINWYGYARQNPLRYIDPTGLISVENERRLESMARAGFSQDEIAETRSGFIDNEVANIQELEKQIFKDEPGAASDDLKSDYEKAVDNYLRNIQESDYDDRSDAANKILNNKLAYEGLELVGTEYMWGGKPWNNKGGLDCSGTAESAIERAVNILVGERNADGQAKDPRLTVPGDGSRGTLNFYDWKIRGRRDGIYDHVTISLGDGQMINPDGGPGNTQVGYDGPWNGSGMIQKRGPFNTTPTNRQVNWRYMLFE